MSHFIKCAACGEHTHDNIAACNECGHMRESANDPASFPELEPRFTLKHMGEGYLSREAMLGGESVARYLHSKIGASPIEHFYALYIDTKGRMLGAIEISRGTLGSSLVHPREVFAPALLLRAAALIVGHNHPSGDTNPSADDRTTTRRLQRAGRLMGIELLDHVIVGSGEAYGHYSFLEDGTM